MKVEKNVTCVYVANNLMHEINMLTLQKLIDLTGLNFF